MIEGFSLGNYLLLVEYTGRLFREGKAVISAELAGVFERLGSNAENWQARLQKLAAGRLLGRFFAASRRSSGARTFGGCPATVTKPSLVGCFNCRWLDRCRSRYRPSASMSLMTSRTVTASPDASQWHRHTTTT